MGIRTMLEAYYIGPACDISLHYGLLQQHQYPILLRPTCNFSLYYELILVLILWYLYFSTYTPVPIHKSVLSSILEAYILDKILKTYKMMFFSLP